jgi:hypothetical protein
VAGRRRDARWGVLLFMARTTQRIRRRSLDRDRRHTARMSLDIVTGAQNLATLSPQDLLDRERPQTAFYNYGFRLQP